MNQERRRPGWRRPLAELSLRDLADFHVLFLAQRVRAHWGAPWASRATIIFAGNFTGRTQTMPLAIYLGFEFDLSPALTLSALGLNFLPGAGDGQVFS
jgi:hypothetical protein